MVAGASDSPVFDFSSLDFESVVQDLETYAQSTYPSDFWTDFNESNPLTFLLEQMGYATDLLAYNLNASTLETIPVTVIREQNFRNLAKSFDYTLKSATPSSTLLTFTLDTNPALYPFTISKHLQIATGDSVIFQPDADTLVSSPVSTVSGVLTTQGEEIYQEAVGTSSGAPGQQFQLQRNPLIDGTLTVLVNSVAYTFVDNAVAAGPADKIFLLDTNESGVTTLTFGDGINGVIPPFGQSIVATYKIGGGTNTNYPIGTITSIFGASDGSSIPAAILSVTNTTAASGGGPKQSLANAKANLPLTVKANDRAVTFEDFAALTVQLVTGVLKAHATAGIPSGGATPVLIFVVPDGGGDPTAVLVNQIIQALKPKKLAGKRVVVAAPTYMHMHIEGDIYVKKSSLALVVENRVINTFLSKYAMDAVDTTFAANFALQDAYDSVAPTVIDGIQRVLLKKFTIDPYYARYVNIPTVGNGTVIGIETADGVLRREWSIQAVNPDPGITCVEYTVTRRILGTITSVTDDLLVDEAADFTTSSLVGLELQVRPQDISTTFTIVSNSSQDIVVSGGLLTVATPDDPYVVNAVEVTKGKILSFIPTADVTVGTNVFPTADTTNWEVGDHILVVQDDNTFTSEVVTVNASVSIVTTDNITFTALAASSKVYYYWVSADGTLSFTVADGSSPFVPGDKLFVDTFPNAGDIQLRDENFPLLDASDMVFNTIGGVR